MEIAQKGKIAIVTGGGSGIGFAIAGKFVQEQITTIIIGRDEMKLSAAKEQLGPLCYAFSYDLNDLASIPGIVEKLYQQFGHIDILVNNAGINMKKNFEEVTDAEFQQILLTNVSAVFTLSRELVKKMKTHGGGSIINISSMASQYGIPKVIAYTASKSAIEGMTRAMAVELAPLQIRVNCIAPGFIATEMSARALNNDTERKQKVMSRTPMAALGSPTDIGDAVFFLATDSARYITGVVLPVDGGNSIGF